MLEGFFSGDGLDAYREQARRKLINFAKHMKPQYADKYSWHHALIASKIDQFYRGEIKRLMIFMPPQHQKSDFASRLAPAFALGRNPNAKIILASYSASLAETFNKDCQKLIDSPEYADIFPNTTLQPMGVSGKWVRNAETFDIVNHEGYFKTVGVGGSTTGKPADYFIIDDPVKDSIEAQSPTIQIRNWEWFNDVVYTRIHNDSGIMLIQTRWDSEDLSGKLLTSMNEGGEQWTVLCLPAIKETNDNPEDPRKIGEALYPQMHNLEKLEIVRKRSLRTFQSLYQQNPQPVQVGGEAYVMFNYDDTVNKFDYNPDLALHVSFDFNVNPYMTAAIWQIDKYDIGDKRYFKANKIEEVCMKSPKNTTKGICTHIRHKFAAHKAGMFIYGDPNGRKEDTRSEKGHNDYLIIRTELEGFKPVLRVPKKADYVNARISFMNTLFSGGYDGLEIGIDRSCVNTIADYQFIKLETDGTKQKLKIKDPNTGIASERYGHCFVGDTIIETKNGGVAIKDIKVGDYVLTRKGYKKVTAVHNNGIKKVEEYCWGKGSFRCTPNHRVFTKENGFVEAGHLFGMNTFCIFERNKIWEQKLHFSMVSNLRDTPIRPREVKEFTTQDGLGLAESCERQGYTGTNGRLKKGIFQKDIIYTIKTATLQTMKLGILFAYRLKSTIPTIITKELRNKKTSLLTFCLLKPLKNLKNGINRILAGIGTGNMLKTCLQQTYAWKSVKSVEFNSPHRAFQGTISVPISAKTDMFQGREENQGKTLKKGFALLVEVATKLINTPNLLIAPRNVVENLENVYDITVEDEHEYFANGILVHNCSDADEYFICVAFANKFMTYINGGKSSPIRLGERRTNYGY